MGGNAITNVGGPFVGTDAATKAYVDSVSGGGSGIPIATVTLTGTAYTTIISVTSGTIQLNIKNTISGGPSGIFFVSKSESFMNPSITRVSMNPGYISNEYLDITWLPGSFLKLHKTGTGHDGLYKVQYIMNN
jgi:hypothetical protein